MKKMSNTVLLSLAVVLAVCSFFLFRELLSGRASSYTSEIGAAFLGSLLTIIITAVMLNKQTEVDMRKDRNAKMLETKLSVYGGLMERLESILCKSTVSRDDVVAVQVLNQRIAFIASDEVVRTFKAFARAFAAAAKDETLSDDEKDRLLGVAGDLSVKIRKDLLSREELEAFDEADFLDLVKTNIDSLRTERITKDGFMDLCDDRERQYFASVLSHLQERDIRYDMATKGLSIKGSDGKAVAWCFPTKAKRNIEILKDQLPEDKVEPLAAYLSARNLDGSRLKSSRVSLKSSELPAEDFCHLLSLIITTDAPDAPVS